MSVCNINIIIMYTHGSDSDFLYYRLSAQNSHLFISHTANVNTEDNRMYRNSKHK